LLKALAKKRLQGWAQAYKTEQDDEKALKRELQQSLSRKALRKQRVSVPNTPLSYHHDFLTYTAVSRLKMAAKFEEEHGLDPKAIIHENLMSDCNSDPDEGSSETREEFKERLGGLGGTRRLANDDLADAFEYVKPMWRSGLVSKITQLTIMITHLCM
jgi:hypothetical protein